MAAWHGAEDAETGEFERDSDTAVKMLCPDILDFDESLTAETTVTDVEFRLIGIEDIGTDDEWEGEVYRWVKVYKRE